MTTDDQVANALYISVVEPDTIWWDDLTPDMKDGWLRGARYVLDKVRAERGRLRAAIAALPDDCHDGEGLGCEYTYAPDGSPERGCYSLQRADVLAAIEAGR